MISDIVMGAIMIINIRSSWVESNQQFFWCVWFRVRVAHFICKQLATEWGISCCTVISVVATMEKNKFINVACFLVTSLDGRAWIIMLLIVTTLVGGNASYNVIYLFFCFCFTLWYMCGIDRQTTAIAHFWQRAAAWWILLFFFQSCVACRQIFMRLVMLLVCIFMIYDCHVGHFFFSVSSMSNTKGRLHSQSDSRVNENQVHSQLDVSIPGAGNSSSSLESTAPQPILICQNSLTSIWNVSITKHEFLRMGKVLGNSIFHPMSRCRISFCVMGLIRIWRKCRCWLGNYYQSFMFNSAKQHSVAQIDGTVELVLSVVVTGSNAAFCLWTPWQ